MHLTVTVHCMNRKQFGPPPRSPDHPVRRPGRGRRELSRAAGPRERLAPLSMSSPFIEPNWYAGAMAPRRDYAGQTCSLSRALEIVGERWSLLIVRDAFLGVRRFGDFAAHLGLPRAVLADRLKSLTDAGVLATADGGTPGYVLTEKGIL